MKALHSAKYSRFSKHSERKTGQHGRRFLSMLLCLCMVVSMMCNFGGMVLSSAGAQSTQYVLNRLADGDTMDSYIGKLLSSEWGSRYAGRVWTDKTVFAYGDNSTDWLKNVLSLHMSTDGLDSEVTFNSDFAHIFSALASSQTTNAAVPIDLMLALDITASMLNSASNMPSGNIDDQARTTWQGTLEGSGAKNSNMALSLAAANELIAQIRAISSDSRISIVVFHGSGYQMIPFVDGDVKFTGYSLRYDVAGGNSLRGEHPQAIIHYTITDSETDGVSNGDYVYDSISGAHYRYDVGKAPENDTWDGSNNSSRQVEPKDTKTFNVDHFKLGLNTDPDRHGVDVIAEKTKSGMKSTDNDSPTQLGGGTGLEGGIYTAMSSVANMRGDTTYTMPDGMKVTRIPVIVIQGDGATNHVLIKEEDPDASRTPGDAYHRSDPWYSNGPYNSNIDRTPSSNSSIEEQLKNQGSSGNWWNIKSPTATACTYADSSFEADFNAVLQAAYWKAAVANAYDKDLADVFVYTVGLGAKTSVLNPNVGFAGNFGEAGDLDGYTDRTGLYQAFNAWRDEDGMDQYPDNDGKGKITYTFNYSPYTCDHFRGEETLNFYIDAETNTFHIEALASQWGYDKVGNDPYGLERPEMTYNYNRLPDNDVNGVKMEDLELNYTKKYFFVESNTSTDANKVREQLSNAFAGIADEVYQSAVFIPLSGDNDAGVADSITYQDPLGEYMEIKNGAIEAPTHAGNGTYDMALLLFGQMHGLVTAGVYDYQWNNKWMEHHKGEPDPTNSEQIITPDKTPFPMGWYRGDDPTTAERAEHTQSDGSGTYPTQSNDGSETYKSAEEARAAGWVFRLNFKTLLTFVPIADAPEDGLPDGLSDQMKNTVYTCYRFAGTPQERNALHMNPVFGDESDIPETIRNQWAEYDKTGAYPETNALYAKTLGVYRLSDIRVWVEDVGDYTDTSGVIVPNTGYDRSLYMDIPAAAVPTQLATITLGENGVKSYETNLGDDHPSGGTMNDKKLTQEDYYAQSTPLRLFYAVGLEEDLILRDTNGHQNGVDFTKISPEYIKSHAVEGQNYVWFISNYFSNTTYDDYVTGANQTSRGDPTMTFSPSVGNRYYIFQKPLPLYAHAYRNTAEGLKPVDNTDDWRNADGSWTTNHENGKGNGSTTWESITDSEGNLVQQRAGSWVGGEYMGTYTDNAAFENAKKNLEDGYITDSTGTKYLYLEDGIVLFTNDALNHVTSEAGGGYSENSISFDSNDFFFLLVEYYVPNREKVTDDDGNEILGATGGRMVQYVVARKGSEFGSGFVSEDINNGDMLCWVSMNQDVNMQFDYLSKTGTGDLTRGEPTFEKLTQADKDKLRQYLTETCGITEDKMMDNPDYNPEDPTAGDARIGVLDYQVKYWLALQQNAQIRAALEAARQAARADGVKLDSANFNKYMQFAVAAKPGGIRSGNMASNVHAKQDFMQDGELVDGNVTGTAENYYVPVVSANSGIGDGAILNNYMGNNGYLEIANQMLHVTKMLVTPEGFELTEEQLNEEFNYQIYVQGVTGTRNAIRTQYNEYGKVWERELAYIDVLTDNSNLVLDNNSRRAVFIEDKISSSIGEVSTAKMVVENGGKYYIANEDGTLTLNADGSVNTAVNSEVGAEKQLYYLYLPSNSSDGHTRRLFQNKEYDGTAEGYPGTYATDKENYDSKFQPNGVTTFVNPGDHAVTGTDPGADNRDSYRETVAGRPAGTRTYWAQDAELIPIDEVQAAETVVGDSAGEIATYAPESVSGGMWTHGNTCAEGHVKLQYYNLVIRRPEGETSETAFVSPLSTRSQYMTVELEFGKNANATDGSTEGPLTADDIYDQIIPTADRPDLFNASNKNTTLDEIAANTAEFTLKHGEGLLLSGLNNRITYRFTEKLTDAQLKAGYTLKRISHVQQRGSDTVYMPGAQEVPVYQTDDGTLTWAIDSDGQENSTATKVSEPFAHTNATIWESYSTMAAGVSGNHHQPQASEGVAINPSCLKQLNDGGCDLLQDDGSTRHYFYYGGKLVDPHYDGEAAGMSRYVLNPTAHFGVNGEEGMTDALTSVPSTILENQTSGDTEYYDYKGVYSVYGNTGWFEEQANFVNTVEPDMLVVTKEVVDKNGNHVHATSDMVFTYILKLTDPSAGVKPALTGFDTIYLWRGSKDTMTSTLTWEDGSHTTQYKMPENAPNLDQYRAYIPPMSDLDGTKEYLQPMQFTDDGVCVFTLKADEAIVFYGIPAGTDYTVTEKVNPNYPIHPTYKADDPYSEAGENVQTGEILHYYAEPVVGGNTGNRTAMRAKDTDNRENYYNLISTGSLTVEKAIHDDDKWEVDKTFSFTVTLTAGGGKTLNPDNLTVTKYKKTAESDWRPIESSAETTNWVMGTDSESNTTYTAVINLKHGERFVISGIPTDTKYTVKETGRDGYNLEYVVNVIETPDITNPDNFIHPTDFSTNGEITEEHPQANWLFVNAKPPFLPFSGSGGVGLFYLLGGALIISGIVFMIFCGKRRVRVK